MKADMQSVGKAWKEHLAAPFPVSCRGDSDVMGIDIVYLDSCAAGCIQTFIACNGHLDRERISLLKECRRDFAIVAPVLEGDARVYFHRLEVLVLDVLRLVNDSKKPTAPLSPQSPPGRPAGERH